MLNCLNQSFLKVFQLSLEVKLIKYNMIYKIAKAFLKRPLITNLQQPYGDLVYTNTLSPKSEFKKVPTFRLIDLNGQLLVKDHIYDTNLLVKILKTIIFVDEMDNTLLKVKGQGTI